MKIKLVKTPLLSFQLIIPANNREYFYKCKKEITLFKIFGYKEKLNYKIIYDGYKSIINDVDDFVEYYHYVGEYRSKLERIFMLSIMIGNFPLLIILIKNILNLKSIYYFNYMKLLYNHKNDENYDVINKIFDLIRNKTNATIDRNYF